MKKQPEKRINNTFLLLGPLLTELAEMVTSMSEAKEQAEYVLSYKPKKKKS